MKKAGFFRKASNLEELKKLTERFSNYKMKYEIWNEVELKDEEFKAFSKDLLEDKEFIEWNKNLMNVGEDGVWNCILVMPENGIEGILVQASGYSYARYTAYLEDINK